MSTSTKPILLSKTDYILYRECAKNTWLKLHRHDVYYKSELSAFEQSIIQTGNEVEEVARGLFPTGVLIEGRDEASQKKTLDYIKNRPAGEGQVLFQPVFCAQGFMAAVDILKYDKESDSYFIYEIKASNDIKESLHLYDLAFQVNLLTYAGVKVGKMHIIHLNSDYVRKGPLDIVKLFTIADVSEQIHEILDPVGQEMQVALEYVSQENEPTGPCACIYKGRSKHCTTFSYSNPEVPEYSVHDIARIGVSKAKLTELIDGNIFYVNEVPEHIELSEIQKNQVDSAISGRTLIKKDKIMEELSRLSFPLYFIDYETFPCAIPRFDGFTPYQQVPFQYSLHILETPDDLISNSLDKAHHKEFLHVGSDDPTGPFAEGLKRDLGPTGSIIVWNKKFECKINNELANRVPSIRAFIDGVNSRVYDLMDVFTKQYYVHKDFQGSTSIKMVLPVLAPELSYKTLGIQEGGTASQKWNEMTTGNISKAEKDLIANNLREYCALDTYAMYAIYTAIL